jgi:hypothetical protein
MQPFISSSKTLVIRWPCVADREAEAQRPTRCPVPLSKARTSGIAAPANLPFTTRGRRSASPARAVCCRTSRLARRFPQTWMGCGSAIKALPAFTPSGPRRPESGHRLPQDLVCAVPAGASGSLLLLAGKALARGRPRNQDKSVSLFHFPRSSFQVKILSVEDFCFSI